MIATLTSYPQVTIDLSGVSRVIRRIFFPLTRGNVAQIIDEIRKDNVPVHVVSCGLNWGFGSHLPTVDECYVLNLSGLNRILDLNLDGNYVEVEPGVTQGMLDDALSQTGRTHYFNVTGAGRQTSVIGNALERGIGYFGSRHEDILDLEVLLSDGSTIRTTPTPYHTGLGPDLRALFVQSSLGIVLSAKIALRRCPSVMGVMVAKPRSSIGDFVIALSRIQSECLICSVPHIANKKRAFTTVAPHLPVEMREAYYKAMTPWSALIPINGPKDVVLATEAYLRTTLDANCEFVSSANLPEDRFLSSLLDLARGIPSDIALPGVAFAALGEIEHADFGEGRAGLIHVVPSCSPRRIQELLNVICHHLSDPILTLNLVNAGMVIAVISISFDRLDQAETTKAHLTADSLLDECIKFGFHPYRLGLNKLAAAPSRIQMRLRSVFDPHGLFCPSKYAHIETVVRS